MMGGIFCRYWSVVAIGTCLKSRSIWIRLCRSMEFCRPGITCWNWAPERRNQWVREQGALLYAVGEIQIAEDLAGAVDVGLAIRCDRETGEAFEAGWIGQSDRADGSGFSGRKIESINGVRRRDRARREG